MDRTDVLHLGEIRAEVRHLIKAEQDSGVRLKDMGARNGHRREFMRAPFREDRMPWDWPWSTLYGLVDGVGRKLLVEFHDLPEVSSPLHEMARMLPEFGGVGAVEFLRRAREDKCVSTAEMAARLKVVQSGVNKLETSDDPRLSSIMRLARGLGGYARFKIEREK